MLEDLSLEEYRQFNPLIEADIFTYLEVKACVERRKVPGGPAPERVQEALEEARQWLRRKLDEQV